MIFDFASERDSPRLSSDYCSRLVQPGTKYGSLNLNFIRNMAVRYVDSVLNMAVESIFLSEIWQFVEKSYYF